MSRGSSFYRRLLAYQVYGANTAVGKTVFSTILCKALTRSGEAWYLKPVSTGPLNDADDGHVKTFAPDTRTACLFQFGEAVSPHIAASASNNSSPPPADTSIVNSILKHLKLCSDSIPSGNGVVLVETAGGVHSPTPSGTSQADLYRPLRLPVFLVADPKLGGISSTISAFESLHVRGYDLDSVFVFEDDYYKNHDYLSEYFYKRGVHTMSLPPPPLLRNDIQEDKTGMAAYYERMSGLDTVQDFVASFHQRHNSRIERLESMALKAHKSIWYPFTQHQDLTPGKILAIDSAYGDFFQTLAPSPSKVNQHSAKRNGEGLLLSTFDASASWWTQGLGHGSSELSLAAAYAAGRYGHVMFAGAINEPALSLAELLLENLENPRLQKVFYSDDGSTGVEVAVKMALTASSKRYGWDISNEEGAEMGEEGVGGKGKNARSKEIGIIGLKGSYHGDTIGAMDCSEGSTYNDKVHWYEGRGYWFDFPQVKMKNGDWILELPIGMEHDIGTNNKFGSLGEIFDKARDKSTMRETYEKYINKTLARLVYEEGKRFGAVVLEPIILGAGGMLFCDPLFQRTLINVVRSNPQIFGSVSGIETTSNDNLAWQGLPIVFDEVFTGLYRLGCFTPSSLLHVYPDISVHAKLLTGGLVPLCVTIASDSIYEAFLSSEKNDALLHGHSYTAHAVGCEVGRTSVQAMLDMNKRGDWETFKSDWADPAQSTNIWSAWSKEFISRISQARDVESVVALGSVLAISLHDGQNKGYTSTAASGLQKNLLEIDTEVQQGFNIHSRVLGNVLYLMASQTSEVATLRAIEAQLISALGAR